MSFVFFDEESGVMTVSPDFDGSCQSIEVRRRNGRVQRMSDMFLRGRIITKLILPSAAREAFLSVPMGAAIIPCVEPNSLEITGIYYKKLRKMKL